MKKHFIFTIFDQMLVSGGNFLTIFLGAIYLSSVDQGILVILLSFYFFCLILSISLVYAPIQSLFSKFKKSLDYIYTAFLYHLAISLGLLTVVYVGLKVMTLFGSVQILDYTIVSFIVFIAVQQIADFGRRVAYVLYSSSIAFMLSLGLYAPRIIAFVILEPQSIQSFIQWLIITSLFDAMVIIVYVMYQRFKQSLISDNKLILEHIGFSKNIAFSAPLGWFVAYSPTLVLGFLSGPILAGILGTLRGIVGMANVFVEMIEVSVIAHLSNKANQGEKHYIQRFMVGLLLVFSLAWILLFILVSYLYEAGVVFIGVEYIGYKIVFLILCAVYLVYFYGRMHVLYCRVFYNTKPELYNSLVSLMSTISLLPLVYFFDIVGAASVFISAQLIAFSATIYKYKLTEVA